MSKGTDSNDICLFVKIIPISGPEELIEWLG